MFFRRVLLVICLLQLSQNVIAQGDCYNIDSISEIRLYFFDVNWDHLLDSMYVVGEKDRVLANIIINGDNYDSVGVRYKGFSSVSVNTIKNPFNISLDYLVNDQDHKGINKIKLSIDFGSKKRKEMGSSGREFYLQNLSSNIGYKKLSDLFNSM